MRTIYLDKNTIIDNEKYSIKIDEFLKDLNKDYPDFRNWLHNKVFVENLLIDRFIIIKEINDEIVGISIMKLSEKKICTFRIHSNYRGLGIGTELMEESIGVLGESFPHITISENMLDMFSGIFKKFDFKLFDTYQDYYKIGVTEYSYNDYI